MRKFKIPSVPPTTNKSIRFPNDIIESVEKAIQGKDCTFSAFVVEAVRVALDNLEEENENWSPVVNHNRSFYLKMLQDLFLAFGVNKIYRMLICKRCKI